ncbi:TRAP-type C4-dicarboxylate transport system, periplasmic component [Vibrio coralliirubri]|uniref:TRAP-type C4-dicarboxylate transport system, periplasmic component n=1 Tax=Vibrio coralliirubri TaxID=1516159 RepID=A0AA86WPE3_9VIBR|nr:MULTISPECIES: TRAP transporter substrate-binding protein [Vibrio]UPR32046.1 TRAP transporter substrate-binding protein [Vibrio crassostreae]CDT80272.1 TRAP-type C4-dicarboxylate transport system, periplasmic component [Vibrio coralliirubri]
MNKFVLTAAVSMLALSTSALAATTIRIGHGANENYHLHRALEKFKEDVETKSQGEFKVQIFPSSQMGPDREMIEGVQSGMLQMAVSPSSFYSSWDASFDVVELPFIYPSKQVALDTVHSAAGNKMLDRLNNMNLQGLGWLENGVRHVSNNKRPITSPEDLQGLKIRTMKVPAHVKTFNSLNATATPMNFGEVYSGLQQGVVDGQENPIAHIYSQRFYEVQDYVSLTGHVITFYIPAMNLEFWHSLSQDDQQLISTAMRDAEIYQQKLVAQEEGAQIESFKKSGTQVNSLTEADLQQFIDATEPVRQEYKNKLGADVYDTWMKAIKENSTQS